jgi:luciferase family oxidoreductase group 1
LRLSAIDTKSPLEFPALAKRLDTLGYTRLWATEHYTPSQSASPTVMAAIAASLTSRIRVGTGGIILRNADVMRVAADFHLLEALYPGRIDLGVVGNLVPDRVRHRGDGRLVPVPEFDRVVNDLATAVRGSLTTPQSSVPSIASIRAARAPDLWVCGLSTASAGLAARARAGFAYSSYLAQFTPAGSSTLAVEAYRQACDHHSESPESHTIVSCYGACAESAADARRYWGPLLPARPSFLGTPRECREQIAAIAAEFGVSEIMVQCYAPTSLERLAAYEMLAESSG